MRYILQAIIFVFCFSGSAQDSTRIYGHSRIRKYIPLEVVHKQGIALTKEDSLQFKFHEEDTLVLFGPGMEFSFTDGTRVKHEPQDSLFLEIYKDVVFGKQPKRIQPKPTLKIWKDDLKIFFDKTVPRKHRKQLMNFAKNISKDIDSLNISQVEERADANYIIYYRENPGDFDLEPRITNRRAGYYISWNGKQHIYRGILKINTFNLVQEKNQLSHLKFYFFKSLGYFHYSTLLECEILLSGCTRAKGISETDLNLLKYHYSYQNCIGVDFQSFENSHKERRKILKEHPNSVFYVVHPD